MLFKNRYGNHQAIHLLPFSVDRTNLFTGRVEFHVVEDFDKPNSNYLSLSFGLTIANQAGITAMAKGTASHPAPSCVDVERRYDDQNSMAIYTYTFEGIATNHGEKFIEFELEFTMNQEPIETHPSFENINNIFGPYDAINRLWPRYISAASAAAGLTGAQNKSGPTVNPLYGVTSYLSPGATYRLSFTDVDVDKDFMDDVGAIVTPPKLGEAFPDFQNFVSSTTRNWLKLAPKIRQRGSAISIVEEFMLSGPRGWDTNVYSTDALQGQAL